MIAFVGATRSRENVRKLRERHVGRILQPEDVICTRLYKGERWALDNGAFAAWRKGQAVDLHGWAGILWSPLNLRRAPWMAVLPDAPTDWNQTCELAHQACALIPEPAKPWPWFVVLQEGATPETVEALLRDLPVQVQGLFLGGADPFKKTACDWVDFAHHRGLRFHFGRAGTPRKIRAAFEAGADSFDSSFPLWTQARFDLFLSLQSQGFRSRQEHLPFGAEVSA